MLLIVLLWSVVVGLEVKGRRLVDESGNRVILRGVSHSGTEYGCVQNTSNGEPKPIVEGNFSAEAVASWGNNVVRIPLNEDCWLGINGPNYSGEEYRAAISGLVDEVLAEGLYAILDMHWTASGSELATGQQPLANADHTPSAWSSIAAIFKNRSNNVIFELFNEPYPGSDDVDAAQWACWLNASCNAASGIDFSGAGMETLLKAVRDAGATNVVLMGGLDWANALGDWLAYAPSGDNLAAAWHSYDFNACNTEACWKETILPVLQEVPLVVTECGFHVSYSESLWGWLDDHRASYLAWTWNTWEGSDEALILDYDGTPTDSWGLAWQSHLAGANPTLEPTRNDDDDDDDGATACVDEYGKCGGSGYDGPTTCCDADDTCVKSNDYYSQCKPMAAARHRCVTKYGKCGGAGYGGPDSCCGADDACVKINDYYAQCRPSITQ
ncbi:hypothetical protein CTAYLR_002483 [Chrysophaeum taylorii]|uniref:CBM1 domain-containing protein n=1 Tax=Chrysophaeum taylorii TaxID=2483200 RepID=A0AAD7UF50_9STRA|nr:hypothetical protein CTAYLR_002483 [Chrysophaeum taylorii]